MFIYMYINDHRLHSSNGNENPSQVISVWWPQIPFWIHEIGCGGLVLRIRVTPHEAEAERHVVSHQRQTQLFVQQLVPSDNQENTKAVHYWSPVYFAYEGPVMRKAFPWHGVFMMSSNRGISLANRGTFLRWMDWTSFHFVYNATRTCSATFDWFMVKVFLDARSVPVCLVYVRHRI